MADIREGHWAFISSVAEAGHWDGLPVLEQYSIHLEDGIYSNWKFFSASS